MDLTNRESDFEVRIHYRLNRAGVLSALGRCSPLMSIATSLISLRPNTSKWRLWPASAWPLPLLYSGGGLEITKRKSSRTTPGILNISGCKSAPCGLWIAIVFFFFYTNKSAWSKIRCFPFLTWSKNSIEQAIKRECAAHEAVNHKRDMYPVCCKMCPQ